MHVRLCAQKDKNTITQRLSNAFRQMNKRPVTILSYAKAQDLPKKAAKTTLKPHQKGLINLKWLKSITTEKPGVILYLAYIPSNANAVEEEKRIFNEIETIKKEDRQVPVILYIITSIQHAFNVEDREKASNLRYVVDKENIHVTSSMENFDMKKIAYSLLNKARNYYKILKKRYKLNKDKKLDKENVTKYTIKLGIASMLKKETYPYTKTDYFDSAYKCLIELCKEANLKKYYFGYQDITLNYLEIKAAADWLLYKIIQIQLRDASSDNVNKIRSIVQILDSHLRYFSTFNYYTPNSYYNLYENYWIYERLKYFISLLKDKRDKIDRSDETIHKYLMQSMYAILRIRTILEHNQDMKLGVVVIKTGEEISISDIKQGVSKYYEKAAEYSYNINPLDVVHLEFDNEIHYRKFILEYNLTTESVNNLSHSDYFKEMYTKYPSMQMYLNMINYNREADKKGDLAFANLKNIYAHTSSQKHLIKFPNVYFDFISKYNDILVNKHTTAPNDMDVNDQHALFVNLITLANYRDLSLDEEELFYSLATSHIESEPKTVVSVNKISSQLFNNKIFNLDYLLVGGNDPNRKVLELLQYEFTLKTNLNVCSGDKQLNVCNLTCIFKGEKRTSESKSAQKGNDNTTEFEVSKVYNEFEHALTKDTPICFDYKLIIKDEKLFMLKAVRFEIKECKGVVFELNVPQEDNKMIMYKDTIKPVLAIKTPNEIVNVGEKEYYRYEFELVKDMTYNVEIKKVVINFKFNSCVKDVVKTAKTQQQQQQKKQQSQSNVSSSNTAGNSNSNTQRFNGLQRTLTTPTTLSSSHSSLQGLFPPSQQQKQQTTNVKSSSMTAFFNQTSTSTTASSIPRAQPQPSPIKTNPLTMSTASTTSSSSSATTSTSMFEFLHRKPKPEFFLMNPTTNTLSEPMETCEIVIDDFEEYSRAHPDNKVSFLIKFKERSQDLVQLSYITNYEVYKKELEEKTIQLINKENYIRFRINTPFYSKSQFDNPYRAKIAETKEDLFLSNTPVNAYLEIENRLTSKVIITNIIINQPQQDQQQQPSITTPLTNVIALPEFPGKDNLISMLPQNKFSIPFELRYECDYKGPTSSVVVQWTTESLRKYNSALYNENTFNLPEINTKCFDFTFDVQDISYDKKEGNVTVTIQIANRTEELKNTIVCINKNSNFFINGFSSEYHQFMPNEIKHIQKKLMPCSFGMLQLPEFKFREISMKSENLNAILYSVYFPVKQIYISP